MNRLLSLLSAGLGLTVALAFPVTASAEQPADAPTAAAEPAQSLSPEVLYTFLLAEIAGARGEVGVAVEAYLELARGTRDARIAKRATEIALFARNMTAAAESARIWAEADPESEDARRVLAGALLGGDARLDEIQIQLARILALTPDKLDQNLLGLNRALARIPDKQEVRTVIDRLTEPYTDHPEAHFARAQAALATQENMDALASIENALGLRPDWEPAILFKAQLLIQAGAAKESIDLLGRYLERHPESRDARLVHARALVAVRQFDAARAEFRNLLAASPEDRDLMYAVALLSTQLNDLDAAAPLFERALAAGHPEADAIRLNLGQIAERRQDPESAVRWYGEVAQGAHHFDAQVRIAAVLARQGKLDEARRHLQAVEGDEDTRKRLVVAESQILRDAGRDSDALQVINTALRDNPNDAELLYESSMLAERLGQMEVMEGRLRKLIALQPDHAHAYNALGYSLADRGLRLDEAETMIGRALELAPNDPFILDSMGWVRFKRGDHEGALGHLERAYGIRPDPEIAAHLGEVLWSLNRRDDARRVWEEALQTHPDNKALMDTVQRLKGR